VGLFELRLADGSDVYFDVQEIEKGKYKGTYTDASMKIERNLEFIEKNNSFKSSTKLISLGDKTRPLLSLIFPKKQWITTARLGYFLPTNTKISM
jgi:hypothetical protein